MRLLDDVGLRMVNNECNRQRTDLKYVSRCHPASGMGDRPGISAGLSSFRIVSIDPINWPINVTSGLLYLNLIVALLFGSLIQQ